MLPLWMKKSNMLKNKYIYQLSLSFKSLPYFLVEINDNRGQWD